MRSAKKFIDVQDAAGILRCHPETVRVWIRCGTLKPVSTRPFMLRRNDILNLPKPKIGRPKKDEGKEVIKNE